VPQIEVLTGTLDAVGACPRLIRDLMPAIWCDVLIATVAADEEHTCLLADPLATDPAFPELLAWHMGGRVPQRYQPYPGNHITASDRDLIREMRKVLRTARR
jgi:hypothetical protein